MMQPWSNIDRVSGADGGWMLMHNVATHGQPALECHELSKNFGARCAVSGVNLLVEKGAIFGFLGRNGSGKTTTIRLILGLLRPSRGSIRVFGCDVAKDRMGAARRVGSLLEARATYDHLSGWENLDLTRSMLGLDIREIDRVLDVVDMRHAATRKVGQYSLGMRQRLGLARALLGRPSLLVLDEPMNGLDPDGIRDMRQIIREMPDRAGATVFLSSHLLHEVQQTATHVGLMYDGRIVMQGPIDELLRQATVGLFIRATDIPKAMRFLAQAGYAVTQEGEGVRIELTRGEAEAAVVNRRMVEAGFDILELSVRQPTLESLYVEAQGISATAA